MLGILPISRVRRFQLVQPDLRSFLDAQWTLPSLVNGIHYMHYRYTNFHRGVSHQHQQQHQRQQSGVLQLHKRFGPNLFSCGLYLPASALMVLMVVWCG